MENTRASQKRKRKRKPISERPTSPSPRVQLQKKISKSEMQCLICFSLERKFLDVKKLKNYSFLDEFAFLFFRILFLKKYDFC